MNRCPCPVTTAGPTHSSDCVLRQLSAKRGEGVRDLMHAHSAVVFENQRLKEQVVALAAQLRRVQSQAGSRTMMSYGLYRGVEIVISRDQLDEINTALVGVTA